MTVICPFCGEFVPDSGVNEDDDVVLCPACGDSCMLTQLKAGQVTPHIDMTTPPPGAWFEQLPDGVRVGMSHRMLPALIFMIPFTLVWGGMSIGAIYVQQFIDGEFDIVASIFGLPFLAATFVLIGSNIMFVAGVTEVTIKASECVIFIGAFGLGWRRRFDPSTVQCVLETCTQPANPSKSPQRMVIIRTQDKDYTFTTSRDPAQLRYLYAILRENLAPDGEPIDIENEDDARDRP